MSAITLRRSIAVLLAPTLITPVLANDTADVPVVEFDPLIITVSKSEQKLSTTPARVTVIGKANIEQNPVLNLSDILKQDPSAYNRSQWGGIGQPSSLSLRGGNITHALVLKDGARINSQNGLSPLYPAFLDLSDVDSIEIAKGAASVQHGADAVTGVIQMRSHTPQKNQVFTTGVFGENQTYKAIVGADLVHDSGAYAQVRGQRLESNGTRVFNTQDENSQKAGYEQKGYSAKLGYDNSQLDASIAISENKGVNEFSNTGWQPNPQIDAKRIFDNRIITAKASYNVLDNLTLSARHSNVRDLQDVAAYASYYNTRNKETDLNAKWGFAPNHNILLGVTHLDSEYGSNTISESLRSNTSKGYYAQHQYNSDSINTQVGVRLEDNERFGSHTVGQGAIRYHVNPKASVYANVGTAFRAPTLNDMYYFYEDDFNPAWSTFGDPNLKPEESLSYEIGADYQIDTNTKVELSAYRTKVDNLIYTKATAGSPSVYANINKARFKGAEVGLTWSKDGFFAKTNYAYLDTRDRSANYGKELVYRPNRNLNFSTGYHGEVYGASVGVNAHSSSYADLANNVRVAGYATVDLHGYWNVHPNVRVFTNIENVGDKKYYSSYYGVGTWYVNGGRQANIGVTLRY